jgi:2-polyprenyl-3-methyl-5-hydroxy-6-metoxy-1,4-benzoquinol methylase
MGVDDFILRINGSNFCVDVDAANKIVGLGKKHLYDWVRFPDDFPALFTCDLYSVIGLRRMQMEVSGVDAIYHVHPKYYMSMSKRYSGAIFEPNLHKYTDSYLSSVRALAADCMQARRIEVDCAKSIRSGDQIRFHYELASKYISHSDVVLNIGCGLGFGTHILAGISKRIIGVDLDPEAIDAAKLVFSSEPADFMVCDALNLPFFEEFDAVVAFEVIEHIPPDKFLREVDKVLKPNGRLFISTPQNSLGHIPTTPDHIKEYSLTELRAIVEKHFHVDEVIGIKQGCIYIENDPVGSNTFLIARKKISLVAYDMI